MRIYPYGFETYRDLVRVARGERPADIWFRNVHFLNVYTGQIDYGHIYIVGDRIAYVGDKAFPHTARTTLIELDRNLILVPGYIEPHAHPCQMYNPLSWGEFSTSQGTLVSINDNLTLLMLLGQQAIDFIDQLAGIGNHIWLWWHTFDSDRLQWLHHHQTLAAWMTHPLVIQGGEFTQWPAFLKGDEELERALFALKQHFGKRVEGHLPGASPEKLNALAAAGITADHEALDGSDVLKRLRIGLYAALRYSSIRPDLPAILREVVGKPELNLARLMLTSDGSSAFFLKQSSSAEMIKLVMQGGISAADAYRMATLNPAIYYALDEDVGGIAPGRLACFNVLTSLENPVPIHVMQRGQWALYGGRSVRSFADERAQGWLQQYFLPKKIDVIIDEAMINQNIDVGIELVNEVITRPYSISSQDLAVDECYMSLIDADGAWKVHTRLKGFSSALLGLASTYSASTDIIVIGRDKQIMCTALSEALGLGGGIVAVFADGARISVPLPLGGIMSVEPMEVLAQLTEEFRQKMQHYSYPFHDPSYTLLFLTATHLPAVRLCRDGVYMIKEQRILRPSVHG